MFGVGIGEFETEFGVGLRVWDGWIILRGIPGTEIMII